MGARGYATRSDDDASFEDNKTLLRGTKVDGAHGKLTMISTNQGGGELKLTINVGDVEFTTESLLAPIVKGSAVYAAAADMKEGQCVIFSAARIRSSSMSERSKVCDTDYFANFTSLKPCD